MASQGTTAVDVAAAADLGSNSFHLIVARMLPGEILVIDRMRERVQLAAGLGANRDVSEEAQQRATLCLERFGSHLSSLPAGHVRAVGTHTFRRARNSRALITRAEKALGHPIEVISGQEEARLIFLGVAHSQAPIDGPRLVVDIGGGSTELMKSRIFSNSSSQERIFSPDKPGAMVNCMRVRTLFGAMPSQ